MMGCPSTNTFAAYFFWLSMKRSQNKEFVALAVRICSGVASTSDCERDFSTMKYIWSSLRNRLKVETVDMLTSMYVHRKRVAKDAPPVPLSLDLAKKRLSSSHFADFENSRNGVGDVGEDLVACQVVESMNAAMADLQEDCADVEDAASV